MSDDIGWRTGKPVLDGKVPQRDSDGCELFEDYFTVSDDSPAQSPSKRQDGAEEQPQPCASPTLLDETFVLDSLDDSWSRMENDSRAGSPIIHPEDVYARGQSSHVFVEAIRLLERSGGSDLHSPVHESFDSVVLKITPTKTDIQAIIAVPDSSTAGHERPKQEWEQTQRTGLCDVASEVLEMREDNSEPCVSSADSGAARRDAELECGDRGPLAFSLGFFITGGEKSATDLFNPRLSLAGDQIYTHFHRHPLFRNDDNISKLACSSGSSGGGKWPKTTLPKASKVSMLHGSKLIWPHHHADTSPTKRSRTEGEQCKKAALLGPSQYNWEALAVFGKSVPKDEHHEKPLRQTHRKPYPLVLPVPKAKPEPTESEPENSGDAPLMSRDLWGSEVCSESTQEPSTGFTQWANNLGRRCGRKSNKLAVVTESSIEGPSGSNRLDHMSSKTVNHAQERDGVSGAAASKNLSLGTKGGPPSKEDTSQEAPKSPKEGSLWLRPRLVPRPEQSCQEALKSPKEGSLWPSPRLIPRPEQHKKRAPPSKGDAYQELKSPQEGSLWHSPKPRREWSANETWLEIPKTARKNPALPTALTELNQPRLKNQKARVEGTSFCLRPMSSALTSQVSASSGVSSAPTELNQHPLQNQKAPAKKTSFWLRPKSNALGSQASETSHGVRKESGDAPMAATALSCHYSLGKTGTDTSTNALPNAPVDKSDSNMANLASIPAKCVRKRRPLLMPGFLKRAAASLEAPPSCALKPLNPAQTMVNKSSRSSKKAIHNTEAQETSTQTSFVCMLGQRIELDETGVHHLRGTFHVTREELEFLDMTLQRANENAPVSFGSYFSTNTVTVGILRLGSNKEKPPAANCQFDTILIPQNHGVKVATIGKSWLLLVEGSSFFVRRGVPFSLKNVGATTAEVLYILALPC